MAPLGSPRPASAAAAAGPLILAFFLGSCCRAALAAAPSLEEEVAAVAAAADDECSADAAASPEGCGLSALQLRATQQEGDATAQQGCKGMPGCATITAFNKEFDSNLPKEMQKGMNTYTEWKSQQEGIKVAVTEDHYYEMYHQNVGSKLGEYMPQGLFGWKFGNHYTLVRKTHTTAVIARSGTITFNLGWWRRSMFWNACVKSLPSGHKFDFSHVTDFNDCHDCPAKMEYTLKKGGLTGKEQHWVITDLVLVKLK